MPAASTTVIYTRLGLGFSYYKLLLNRNTVNILRQDSVVAAEWVKTVNCSSRVFNQIELDRPLQRALICSPTSSMCLMNNSHEQAERIGPLSKPRGQKDLRTLQMGMEKPLMWVTAANRVCFEAPHNTIEKLVFQALPLSGMFFPWESGLLPHCLQVCG